MVKIIKAFKVLLIASIIVLTVSSAQARVSNQELCIGFASVAKDLMIQRQNAVPLSEVLAEIDSKGISQGATRTYKQLAIAAYKEPLYNTYEFRKEAVEEFSNKILLLCLEKLK